MLLFDQLSAPLQLLLVTARCRLREHEVEQIRTLALTMDWTQFLALAAHHRVSPLVFESLDAVRPPGLPEAVREELQHRARSNAFEALRAASEVRRITHTFADAGIEITALKGIALSQVLYGNPNTRHVGDIDLLTRPQRLPEQIELLQGLGYERINPAAKLTPRRLTSYIRFWKDLTASNRTTGFDLDLHWRLFNNRFHPANRLLVDAGYTTINAFGTSMRVFAMRDQFLYIAAHAVFDSFTYLKSLADVAAFLRVMTPEELAAALEHSAKIGLLAHVSAAIQLANLWMGLDVASPLLLPASEPLSRLIGNRTSDLLIRQHGKPHRSFQSPRQWLTFERALVPGMRSRLEMIGRFMWRPRVWTTVHLPDRFFWLYPLLGLLLPPRRHTPES